LNLRIGAEACCLEASIFFSLSPETAAKAAPKQGLGFGMFGFIFAHFTSNNKGIWKKNVASRNQSNRTDSHVQFM